jgi:hypothetical protein
MVIISFIFVFQFIIYAFYRRYFKQECVTFLYFFFLARIMTQVSFTSCSVNHVEGRVLFK